MKVVSWNIGNFIWAKYLPGRDNYAFHIKDIDEVYSMISKENPDIIFLQECTYEYLPQILEKFKHLPYWHQIPSDDTHSDSLFISRYPITDIEHSKSHDYLINGITFFPIHLYAFSPKIREEKIKELLNDLPDKKGVILGDTNFWIINNYFISSRDKNSYNLICKNHKDILQKLGATCRIFLSLDKFFVTDDITYTKEKITRHKIGLIDHYMISVELVVDQPPTLQ